MEVGMELRALRVHHAVDGPDAALFAKRAMIRRVPVPRGEDREPARETRPYTGLGPGRPRPLAGLQARRLAGNHSGGPRPTGHRRDGGPRQSSRIFIPHCLPKAAHKTTSHLPLVQNETGSENKKGTGYLREK